LLAKLPFVNVDANGEGLSLVGRGTPLLYIENQVWMWKYNNERPHSALQYLTPGDFLLKYGKITLDNVEDFGSAELSFPHCNKIPTTSTANFQ